MPCSPLEVLLSALLTIARAWYAAGQPKTHTPKLCGYEQWTRIVGGMFAYAGVKDFLANLEELHALVDEEGPQWGTFLQAWCEVVGKKPVSVKELAGSASTTTRIVDTLPRNVIWDANNLKASCIRLGKVLQKRIDRVYSDYRLERDKTDKHNKNARWKVVNLRVVAGSRAYPRQCENSHEAGAEEELEGVHNIEIHTERSSNNYPQLPALPANGDANGTEKVWEDHI